MNGDTFADGRTVIISNADVGAVGIGLELLGSAKPDQEIAALNLIKRQPGQNDVGKPAVLRHAGENTENNAAGADRSKPSHKLFDQ